MSVCTIITCERDLIARGWCGMHYQRWLRFGDPHFTMSAADDDPLILRLGRYALIGDDCWEWTGSKDRDGYAQVWWEGRVRRAHRLMYQELVGEIPDPLQIDHLCRNRGCVNPDHMEAVTLQENVRRQYAWT